MTVEKPLPMTEGWVIPPEEDSPFGDLWVLGLEYEQVEEPKIKIGGIDDDRTD